MILNTAPQKGCQEQLLMRNVKSNHRTPVHLNTPLPPIPTPPAPTSLANSIPEKAWSKVPPLCLSSGGCQRWPARRSKQNSSASHVHENPTSAPPRPATPVNPRERVSPLVFQAPIITRQSLLKTHVTRIFFFFLSFLFPSPPSSFSLSLNQL